jgi:hypothetical protein
VSLTPFGLARPLAAALCAAVLVATGCGDDDEGDAPTTPGTQAGDQALWPPPKDATDDPLRAARTFVEEYIGVQDPPLSDFRETGQGAGEVDVYRRGEDGRALDTVISSLSLRQLDSENWSVIAAQSAEVEITTPEGGAEIASPVHIAGRGRGFEGTVVLEVREQYAVRPLAQKPTIGGSFDKRKPFAVDLRFDAGDATAGAIVATTGSGIAAADGFAAFSVRFSSG